MTLGPDEPEGREHADEIGVLPPRRHHWLTAWSPVRYLIDATAVCLIALAVLVTADSVSRRLFDTPLRGVFEFTQLVSLTVIAVGIAAVSATDSHISLEIGRNWLGPRGRKVADVVAGLTSAAMFGALAYYCTVRGIHDWRSGSYWIGYINIPTVIPWSILGITSAFSAASSVRSMFVPANRSGYVSDLA